MQTVNGLNTVYGAEKNTQRNNYSEHQLQRYLFWNI